jgi:ribonuclease HI
LIDVGLSLGFGTNNIGELAALFICLSELLKVHAIRPFSNAVIFCDSKYAIGLTSSSKRSASNCELVDMLRSLYGLASAAFQITLHWVKGHSMVGGNLRVDLLSKFFASGDYKIDSSSAAKAVFLYATCKHSWKFGYPLCSVPLHFFKPSAESASISNWSFGNAFKSYAELSPPLDACLPVVRKRKAVDIGPPAKRKAPNLLTSSLLHCGFYDTESETLDFKHGDYDDVPLRSPISLVASVPDFSIAPVASSVKRKLPVNDTFLIVKRRTPNS